MSIFKDCDIRGIYGSEFAAEDVYRIGRAVGILLKGRDITVAGDVRRSTPEIKDALIAGLKEEGAIVRDIGIVPTPVAYYAKNTCGLAIVTASHNPAQYNGIKLMLGDEAITSEDIYRIRDLAGSPECNGVFPVNIKPAEPQLSEVDAGNEILTEYKNHMISLIDEKSELKVVMDLGNGTTCGVAPELYRRLGYDVVELYGTPDGSFPNRSPNPAEFENIRALCAAVVEKHADFGIAFDGDGDRAVFVDNLGRPLISEKALILLYESVSRRPGAEKVVYDQKCSRIVKNTIERMGGIAIPERSGHAFIKRCFIKNGCALAGEISGHFFFGELGHDDGMYAGLKLGQWIGASGKTLAQLADKIPNPFISPDLRFKVPYDRMDGILKRIKEDYADAAVKISEYDGIRVEAGSWWFLVRRSVTEQAMTVKIEADSPEMLEKTENELVSKYFK